MAKGKLEDRLSELPDDVIDHIMSFLNEEDIVSTAVSSKTWRRVRSTHHPVLNLNDSTFIRHRKHRYTSRYKLRVKFMVFVYHALQEFLQSKALLQKFSLSIGSGDEKENWRIHDDWIQFALNNNVVDLNLSFTTKPIHCFPQIKFSSNLLTVLRLSGCELNVHNFSENTKCESLRDLILVKVRISENIIQCLINSFPCIINFVLKGCQGANHLKLYNLNKLENVQVCTFSRRSDEIVSIHIEALSLRSFKLNGYHYENDINLDGCRNLVVLYLDCEFLPISFCENLSSNFPFLRTFFLYNCINLGRIKIASEVLESLTLDYVEGIVDATIEAPNLHSFKYNGDLDNLFPFSIYTPGLREATITQSDSILNTAVFFTKLRALFRKLGPDNTLCLEISSKATFNLEELRKIPLPQRCRVKHLKLNLHSIHSTYIGLVDGILWSCHPETLSIVTGHNANNEFIKALYGEVRERRRMQSCCKSRLIRCWRHDLKDFEIEGFSGFGFKKSTLAPNQTFSFKFKW